MPDAITVENVAKHFQEGTGVSHVLRDLSLRVAQGEFVSLMGPSGSGKTTLLALVAGLDVPDSGSIRLAGRALDEMTEDERSDLRLRSMGLVFQSFNLLPTFSVLENVLWPLEFTGAGDAEARARARAGLAEVGLAGDLLERRPAELSGGEQQRVAIARALVTDPGIVLADEPTGNLDSESGRTVLDLLRRLNQERGATVVLVTHSAAAATWGDRTVELRDGRIVRESRPTEQRRELDV
ncbi:ABC transporter ATP-binding protein [bacterium]|nr:ABC transporter ATP-binding protein [bacterium]